MPDPRPDGDLYLAFIHTDDSRIITGNSPAVQPSGSWTTISTTSAGGAGCSLGAWYKIGDNEPADYGWALDSTAVGSAGIIRISDIDVVDSIDSWSMDTGFSGSPSCSTVTASFDDTLLLYVCSLDRDAITLVPRDTNQLYRNDAPDTPQNWSIWASAASYNGPANGSASNLTSFIPVDSDEWCTASILIKPAIATTESVLQDSFTFSDQGTAQYSNVVNITDGTPGFQENIDYGTQNAAGVLTATLADSFTQIGKLVRDLIVDRQITDTATYTDTITSESTQPLWSRVRDSIKEIWSRKTDTNKEVWSRATDTNREQY
jgi:hypothetical protein